MWPHRPQIRLPSTHFGLLIGAKSTLGALLIPLFGQFLDDFLGRSALGVFERYGNYLSSMVIIVPSVVTAAATIPKT